jgi:outer membrane immunogenic protein
MKTKSYSYILAAAMSAFVVTGAVAADMPVYKAAPPPVVVPPPLTWAGFYVGVNGGAVWNKVKGTNTDYIESCDILDCYLSSFSNSHSKTKVGGTFGGQIGYNWQGGPWVYGVEADLNWASAKVSATRSLYDPFFDQGVSGSVSSELTWLGTIRGRLGYAWGPTMVYGTGGVAFGGVKNSISATAFDNIYGIGVSASQSKTSTKTGWTLGGGIEHMFSPHWTVKAEALYVDLGNTTLAGVNGGFCGPVSCISGSSQTKVSHTAVIARVGVNYKFGGY